MTYHHLRAPRPAAAPPAARQPGPVTMALRAMQAEMTKPRPVGPVTAAILAMRAADPAFDTNPDLRTLRRALADRIEADIAALDMLGGDIDLEDDELDRDVGDEGEGVPYGFKDATEDDEAPLGWCENTRQLALGPNTEDGDATALESFGAGFRRSGRRP